MSAQAGNTLVTFNITAAEIQVAAFCVANNLTTDAERAAFVSGITAGSAAELAIVKAFANCFHLSPAPPAP